MADQFQLEINLRSPPTDDSRYGVALAQLHVRLPEAVAWEIYRYVVDRLTSPSLAMHDPGTS